MNINLDDSTLVRVQLAILVAALVVISARLYPGLRNSGTRLVKVSNYVLAGLGAFALLVYVNFHPFSPRQHYWDSFHYYIGSKYFPELGYTRLYGCVVRAEAESNDPSVKTGAYTRDIGNLSIGEDQTNVPVRLVPAKLYFFDDTFCKARFSALRWSTFKSDIEFFHTRIDKWNQSQVDHGFNAPPAWTLVGGFISNLIPLSDSALMGITLIDITLLFGSVACLVWAFGLPTTAFAVIVGTASMESWAFTGGSMLRLDWFFMATFSVCAMKREHYVLAGAALGYAAMLRLFPAVFALGPFVGLLYAIYKRQYDLKVVYGKFFGGMVISVVVLVASATAVYGVAAYKEFIGNTNRMSNAVSINRVGLRDVLVYNYDASIERGGNAANDWRIAKIKARKKVVPIYVAVVAIALLFFIPAVISGGPWQAIALGALFVPFMWTDLSNYYYLFLMIVATLFAVNWKVGFPLLGIGIVTKIGWASGMIDAELYFFTFSAAICIGALAIWWQVNSLPLFWRQAK